MNKILFILLPLFISCHNITTKIRGTWVNLNANADFEPLFYTFNNDGVLNLDYLCDSNKTIKYQIENNSLLLNDKNLDIYSINLTGNQLLLASDNCSIFLQSINEITAYSNNINNIKLFPNSSNYWQLESFNEDSVLSSNTILFFSPDKYIIEYKMNNSSELHSPIYRIGEWCLSERIISDKKIVFLSLTSHLNSLIQIIDACDDNIEGLFYNHQDQEKRPVKLSNLPEDNFIKEKKYLGNWKLDSIMISRAPSNKAKIPKDIEFTDNNVFLIYKTSKKDFTDFYTGSYDSYFSGRLLIIDHLNNSYLSVIQVIETNTDTLILGVYDKSGNITVCSYKYTTI